MTALCAVGKMVFDMTEDLTYNGWCNHETWLASLWLNNDESAYAVLRDAYREGDSDFDHAEWLERVMRDQVIDGVDSASFWSDLIGTALSRVDWLEVIVNNK